jgi:hypothetical protein
MLVDRKTAYRELLAEVGDLNQKLLQRGLAVVGVDVATEVQLDALDRALAAMTDAWDQTWVILNRQHSPNHNPDPLRSPDHRRAWIQDRSSDEIGRAIAEVLHVHRFDHSVLSSMVDVLRDSVALSIERAQMSRTLL